MTQPHCGPAARGADPLPAAHGAWDRHKPQPRAVVCETGQLSFPQRPGCRRLVSRSPVCHSISGQPRWDNRHEHRQRLSELGVLGSRGALPPGPPHRTALAPRFVCGAVTRPLPLQREMPSGHVTGCRLCPLLNSGKNAKNPFAGDIRLLTTGDLIRVRVGMSNHPCLETPVAPMQRAPV